MRKIYILRVLISFIAAILVTGLVIFLLSEKPGKALLWLFTGVFRSRLAFGNFLETAARLGIAGMAASLAFRSGLFNLGGEGQALCGGLTAAAMALLFPNLPGFWAIMLAPAAGIVAGGAMGGISGILKTRWNVDELISSFLIAAAVLPIAQVLLTGVMKDADSYLIAAPPLSEAYRLKSWLVPSRLGIVTVWSLLLNFTGVMFLYYTRRGYEWRLRGANELFARYGGIRTGRIAVNAMILSGSLFGLAGTAALLDSGQAVQGFSSGLGWNGLAVALIAGSRPEFVLPAALAYAWLEAGAEAAMLHSGLSFALSGLIQAMVLLLITAKVVRDD